jgi:hypothetical protein
VFGTSKILFLLAFTIAGYNIKTARSFRMPQAGIAAKESGPPKRARRRKGTYQDVPGLAGPATPGGVSVRGPPVA